MSKNISTFLVIPDLHGRLPQILVDCEFDAIICPGDICLDNSRDLYQKFFKFEEENSQCDISFSEFLHSQLDENEILNLKNKSYEKGREILEFLNNFQKPVYLVPGNWDPTQYCDGNLQKEENIWKNLLEGLENIYDCEYVRISNDLYQIIGYGSTSSPEILDKNLVECKIQEIMQSDLDDEEIDEEIHEILSRHRFQKGAYEQINQLFDKKEENKFTIYISHNSPYNTPLDKINNENSPANGKHYGSILSRDIIEKYQPQLVISGHIHEGVGVCKIKESICLNAGFGDSINHVVTIDLDSNKILEIKKYGENQQ